MFWLLGIIISYPSATRYSWMCWLLLLCYLPMTGCSLTSETHRVFFLAKRTTKLEPRRFPYLRDEKLSQMRNRSLAKHAWHEIAASSPPGSFSEHYARGFIHGFADFLYRGGSGEPPLVPPRDYWHAGYQSVKGKQAIQQWFDGFRHGSEECEAHGYRELVVTSSSMVTPHVVPPGRDTLSDTEPPRQDPLTGKIPPSPTHASTNSRVQRAISLRSSPFQRHRDDTGIP